METTQRFPVVEITLAYNTTITYRDRPCIRRSQQAYELLLEHWNKETINLFEEFKVVLLNSGNKLLGIYEATRGGITGTVVDPRLIFVAALNAGATKIILAHNHPSGEVCPSEADRRITTKLQQAGAFLEIAVADHLIVCPDAFYSFADEGVL